MEGMSRIYNPNMILIFMRKESYSHAHKLLLKDRKHELKKKKKKKKKDEFFITYGVICVA